MAAQQPRVDAESHWLSHEEGRQLFEELTQEWLGMTGAEFLRRYDAGEFDAVQDDPAHPEIMRLVLMSDIAR